MHATYEVFIFYSSKVIAKVKVDNRQTDRQTNKQTGQKQYAPDHLIQGHKNKQENNLVNTKRIQTVQCIFIKLGTNVATDEPYWR